MGCGGAELDIFKQLTEKELQKIDSCVLEYHPDAYGSDELLAVRLEGM